MTKFPQFFWWDNPIKMHFPHMEKLCQKPWNIYHLEMIFPLRHTKTIIYYIGDWYPKNWTVWYKTVAPAARNAATRFSQLDQEPRHFFCQPKRWVGSASCCESPKFGTQKSTVQRLSSSDYVRLMSLINLMAYGFYMFLPYG